MTRILPTLVFAAALPCAASGASRSYDTAAFTGVSVAAGIEAQITLGDTRSIVAETDSDDFEDLKITVEGDELRITRPARSWFSRWFSGRSPDYHVRVVAPVLRSVAASSGAEVNVKGNLQGPFTVTASSGSEVEVDGLDASSVKASASSGSEIEIAGSCDSLDLEASSGSDLDADDLRCGSVAVRASSGSSVSAVATRRVSGKASSGASVRIRGNPPAVQVETSSGANVRVRD